MASLSLLTVTSETEPANQNRCLMVGRDVSSSNQCTRLHFLHSLRHVLQSVSTSAPALAHIRTPCL